MRRSALGEGPTVAALRLARPTETELAAPAPGSDWDGPPIGSMPDHAVFDDLVRPTPAQLEQARRQRGPTGAIDTWRELRPPPGMRDYRLQHERFVRLSGYQQHLGGIAPQSVEMHYKTTADGTLVKRQWPRRSTGMVWHDDLHGEQPGGMTPWEPEPLTDGAVLESCRRWHVLECEEPHRYIEGRCEGCDEPLAWHPIRRQYGPDFVDASFYPIGEIAFMLSLSEAGARAQIAGFGIPMSPGGFVRVRDWWILWERYVTARNHGAVQCARSSRCEGRRTRRRRSRRPPVRPGEVRGRWGGVGGLRVLREEGRSRGGHRLWLCECLPCGGRTRVRSDRMPGVSDDGRRDVTRSCGCLGDEHRADWARRNLAPFGSSPLVKAAPPTD